MSFIIIISFHIPLAWTYLWVILIQNEQHTLVQDLPETPENTLLIFHIFYIKSAIVGLFVLTAVVTGSMISDTHLK